AGWRQSCLYPERAETRNPRVTLRSRPMKSQICRTVLSLSILTLTLLAQVAPYPTVVPSFVKFSGTAYRIDGTTPASGTIGVIFSIYSDQTGGSALWQETQSVTLDAQGRYTVMLGDQTPSGLPMDIFASGSARWISVLPLIDSEPEQARVQLSSVP